MSLTSHAESHLFYCISVPLATLELLTIFRRRVGTGDTMPVFSVTPVYIKTPHKQIENKYTETLASLSFVVSVSRDTVKVTQMIEKGINSKLYNSSQLHKRGKMGRARDPSLFFTAIYSHWVVPDEASSSQLPLSQYILWAFRYYVCLKLIVSRSRCLLTISSLLLSNSSLKTKLNTYDWIMPSGTALSKR